MNETLQKAVLAGELVKATHATEHFEFVVNMMMTQIRPFLVDQVGEAGATEFTAMLLEEIEKLKQQITNEYAIIFAETYTVEELEAAVAYHTSPLGKALHSKRHITAQKGAEVGQRFSQMLEKIMQQRVEALRDGED